MRDLRALDAFRLRSGPVVAHYGGPGDHETGVFVIPSPVDRAPLAVIASAGEGWDHVSVSRANRTPDWREMEHVKRLFFREDETAMQLHVPPAEHVNMCATALHLWRPTSAEIPRPPRWMVGRYPGWEADMARDRGEAPADAR